MRSLSHSACLVLASDIKLRQVYIINAPAIFNVAFALIKPILSPRTLQKLVSEF